ncbi:6382_t:CDS:2, partial [Dentiscutata erythropus]
SSMTETAGQLLGHAVPVCRWIPQGSPNPSTTAPAYPRFPNDVREWTGFFRVVRLGVQQHNLPAGQFPTLSITDGQPLRVEGDAKTRLYANVLLPVKEKDYSLKHLPDSWMPVEMKTRHNLDLRGYNFWDIYRYNDRRGIMDPNFGDQCRRFDPNFKFKKRIPLQIFGEMACNGLHYGILSNYSDTYFFKREETTPTTLYVSRVVQPTDTNPTLRECVYYISQLAINDNVGDRLGCGAFDNFSSNDNDDDSSYHDSNDYDDPDYDPDDSDGDDYVGLRKRQRKSKRITVGDYIGGGSFGKVFSGCYDKHNVAWKTCDVYKQQEEMKTLKHIFYFKRMLRLTKKEKELIVNQLKSIHNYGVLHNDISKQNILYEPKSRHYFFIDFGLSEIVNNESPKLRKEERRLKRLLRL